MRSVFLMFVMMLGIAVAASAQVSTAKPAKSGTRQSATKATKASPGAPVNLNTATQAQLVSLPGIGPKAAQRIIEYRQKNGNFKKPEDLMNVKGIGEKSFLKLKPLVVISGEHANGADRLP